MKHDVERALGRSGDVWTNDISHVDAEQAYIDRTVLANEVTRLMDAVADAYSEAIDAYGDALNAWTQLADLHERKEQP
jgi:hypothetical protein